MTGRVLAQWNASLNLYEALIPPMPNVRNVLFSSTIDDVPIPNFILPEIYPQGGTSTPGNSVVKAVVNPDGTVTLLVDPKDANGNPTGAGLSLTVTASNGQQETAIWNPATQDYPVTFSPNGNGSSATGSNTLSNQTFDVSVNGVNGISPLTLAQNVKVNNSSSSGTSGNGGSGGTSGSGDTTGSSPAQQLHFLKSFE